MSDRYEVLVVGSGEAGKYLAWTMAKADRRTALVERRLIGGSCPNIACLPSKNVIYSAKVASYLRRSADFGAHVAGPRIDMAGVYRRKQAMADDLVSLHGVYRILRGSKRIACGSADRDGRQSPVHSSSRRAVHTPDRVGRLRVFSFRYSRSDSSRHRTLIRSGPISNGQGFSHSIIELYQEGTRSTFRSTIACS
jgi:choline dehydrogenase-like flavoprotein